MPEMTVPDSVLHALRESEARFEAFIEESPAVAWMKDAAGRYVYVNETLVRTYGLSKESVLGRTDLELLPGETAELLRANDERVRCTRSSLQTVERIPAADGRFHSWRIWKFPFDNGVHLYVGGLAFDITDQLANEEAVRQMQKLDSIGRLAAGVAHDFNNLLTVQQVYLSLVQADPRLHEELREPVERIAEASERAASLTRQLLMFSRKQVMKMVPFNLNDAVSSVAKMLGRVLGEHITLELVRDRSEPRVCADSGMLEQVLMNLVLNARDAMPDGGRLEIATGRVTLDESAAAANPEARAGTFACLSVTDTGVGIPEGDLSKLFEPFFTTKELGKGTGLGLPTVYGIVKQHDGWLEVSSAVGRGTNVRIYLPTANGEVRPVEAPASRRGPTTGEETILVVEDEKPLRRVVQMILERSGYRVFTAADGIEALDIWSEHRDEIDLLLTDLVMPSGLSGMQLAERLRRDRPELKVVFTSGYSAEATAREELVSAGSMFLQKPYVSTVLQRTVRDLLDR